jgi:predicted nuclease of restriction endonuclease-like (RecB) superfamily
MQGFSSRNLKYMVHFAKEYPDLAIGQQLVAQIPWGHNILLLQKLPYWKKCAKRNPRGTR